jgi:hypothetical protein
MLFGWLDEINSRNTAEQQHQELFMQDFTEWESGHLTETFS